MLNEKYVTPVEGSLEHLLTYYSSKKFQKLDLFAEILCPFRKIENKKLTFDSNPNKDYFKIDFNDFLDFSTTELPGEFNFDDLPDYKVLLFDPLEPEEDRMWFDSLNDEKFCVLGSGVGRVGSQVTSFIKIGVTGDFKTHLDLLNREHCKGYFEDNQKIPFVYLFLSYAYDLDDKEWYESGRFTSFSPVITGMENYEESFFLHEKSYMWDILNLESIKDDIRQTFPYESLEAFNDDVMNNSSVEYEICRLMFYLPKYIEFMYDLVVEERKKTGSTLKTVKKKGIKKLSSKPIYKLIKSVRIVRTEEQKTRERTGLTERQYTPPSFRFKVTGHWRRLKYTWSVGHDQNGNEILGKTWISEFEKNTDFDERERVVVEKSPNIVINVKQPLSYGRDLVKSHEKSKIDSTTVLDEEHSGNPSEEWMYEERKKLSSGLRYLIFRRDSFKCVLCGRSTTDDGVKLYVDHILPVSKWGLTKDDNLRTLCVDCNVGKSDLL